MSGTASHDTGDSGFRSDGGTTPSTDGRDGTAAELRERLLDACRYGRLADVREVVGKSLVDLPSCVVKDPHADTPLHVAALHGNKSIVEYLIDGANCDAESMNAFENTPLHRAARRGRLEIVKYLVEEKKCDPMCLCHWNRTPLHNACRGGQINVVKYLMSAEGVDVSAKDSLNGQTPLQLAAEIGTKEIVQYMMENGVSSESKPYTLVHLAAFGGKLETVKYLLNSKKYNGKEEDKEGLTPLHSACKSGQLDTVKYLVEELKMDLKPQRQLLSPLDVAAANGRMDVVRYLVEEKNCEIEHGIKYHDTPLHHVVYGGHLEIIKYFVDERHCDPACQGKRGRTPLHIACLNGKREIVDYLVSKKEVNALVKDAKGQTSLHLAASAGHLDLVKLLVYKSNCDHHVLDNSRTGKSPSSLASENNHAEVVCFFKRLDNITSSKLIELSVSK